MISLKSGNMNLNVESLSQKIIVFRKDVYYTESRSRVYLFQFKVIVV